MTPIFDFVGVTDFHGDDDGNIGGGEAPGPKPTGPGDPRMLLTLDVDDQIDPASRDWLTLDENGRIVRTAEHETRAAEVGLRFESWRCGQEFDAEQGRWAGLIGSRIRADAVHMDAFGDYDFDEHPFKGLGGYDQARRVFGGQFALDGFHLTAVVGDAEFGDNATLRRTLHRAKLPYALGASSDLQVFLGTPALQPPAPGSRRGRPRTRRRLPPDTPTIAARTWAATHAPRRWRLVSWRNGTHPPWRARFAAVRVTPAHDWREQRLAPEVWLLCERDLGADPRTKYYLVDLPPTASLRALVRLAHQRWAIEQQYQELKDEIGLDHFEGRTLPGWQRHVVLTALAYSFLQNERRRRGQTSFTLPRVRAVIQEVLTAHFFMTQPHYLKWMLKLKEVELRN